jgi:hypothetical protein
MSNSIDGHAALKEVGQMHKRSNDLYHYRGNVTKNYHRNFKAIVLYSKVYKVQPFKRSGTRAHSRCDQSIRDAYSS